MLTGDQDCQSAYAKQSPEDEDRTASWSFGRIVAISGRGESDEAYRVAISSRDSNIAKHKHLTEIYPHSV